MQKQEDQLELWAKAVDNGTLAYHTNKKKHVLRNILPDKISRTWKRTEYEEWGKNMVRDDSQVFWLKMVLQLTWDT